MYSSREVTTFYHQEVWDSKRLARKPILTKPITVPSTKRSSHAHVLTAAQQKMWEQMEARRLEVR